MPGLVINSLLREIMSANGYEIPGTDCLQLSADSVRSLISEFDASYPGTAGSLRAAALAIDGEIYINAFAESLQPDSEVVFIPALEGG